MARVCCWGQGAAEVAWRTDFKAQLQARAEQEDLLEFARALGYDEPL